MKTHEPSHRIEDTLQFIKVAARAALGLVWINEGLVPKILFLHSHPEQIDLVRGSHLFWPTPEFTLVALGLAQIVLGAILIIGWRERAAVATATLAMFVLIILVASGRPQLLTDPFGALAKDFCLVSCAVTVWLLAPLIPHGAKALSGAGAALGPS